MASQSEIINANFSYLNDKIKEIELFKFPNALIIGEPTINNGQISGFSSANYLALPFVFDTHDRAFEFDYAFMTGGNVATPQNLFGSNYCIASYISGGKLIVRVSSNGTSWNALDIETSLTVQANTTYYIKLIFNKLSYEVKSSTDGVEYTQVGYRVTTEKPHAGDVYIGIGNNKNNPFMGIINLNKWMIKLNNAVIWQGMDDAGLSTRADISLSNLDEEGEARFSAKQDVLTAGTGIKIENNVISNTQTSAEWGNIQGDIADQTDLNDRLTTIDDRIEDLTTARFPNVVIIGTPHIEGGQVSNYSSTSYLQFPFVDISRGQPFDIYFSFTTAQDVTTQQNILDAYFGIALAIQNGRGVMALSSNGTSWDIGNTTGTNALLPNTTYYVKYSWTGTQYNASLSTNDETYVPDMIINSTLSPHKTTIFIGGSPNIFGAGSSHPFKGTINFNKSKVVVNGITVWEGMADVGLASRANVSLNNLDEVGEKRFTDLQTEINTKANNSDLTAHTSNGTIHVTASDKIAWSNKVNQDQLSGYGSELDYADETLSLLNTSGDVLSSVNIKSTPDLDNKSINLNSSEQLQAIGIIDSNGSAMKTWRGTLAEYNALATKDDNTLYKITDDTDTGTDLLQMIYPVGSLYLTTNATCPLANLFGTWSKVGEKLLVDVPSQIAVRGNGISLGLTSNGTNIGTLGYATSGSVNRAYTYSGDPVTLPGTTSGNPIASANATAVGITTDPTKSGMVADINSTSMAVNIFRRIL